jgi:hypothetical protein
MKVKVTTSILREFRNPHDAACRQLPRCRICGRALHKAEIHAGTCAACRKDRRDALSDELPL